LLKNLRLINKLDCKYANTFCILLAIMVLAIDYFTGKDIQFPILYIFPAGIAAWQNKKNTAYALAIILPIVRVGFHIPWHEIESIYYATINAVIIITALTLLVYLVNRTALQEKELEKRVKILEGILPICSYCKKIRNEKDEYEQLEKYISEHSDAQFSHGICPECLKELYPEFAEKEKK
jgi:hypothetical protein